MSNRRARRSVRAYLFFLITPSAAQLRSTWNCISDEMLVPEVQSEQVLTFAAAMCPKAKLFSKAKVHLDQVAIALRSINECGKEPFHKIQHAAGSVDSSRDVAVRVPDRQMDSVSLLPIAELNCSPGLLAKKNETQPPAAPLKSELGIKDFEVHSTFFQHIKKRSNYVCS
jgi:hypothetical protein